MLRGRTCLSPWPCIRGAVLGVFLTGAASAVASPGAVPITDLARHGAIFATDLTVADGKLYFAVHYSDNDRHDEVWVSDDTGTVSLLPRADEIGRIRKGIELEVFSGQVFIGVQETYVYRNPYPYPYDDAQTIREPGRTGGLWRTDGSVRGTTQATSVSRNAQALTPAGERLFFIAPSGGSNADLCWIDRRDNSACAGRSLWVEPGQIFELPTHIQPVTVGDHIFVSAADGFMSHDFELWTSDGTVAGTRVVADIWPGELGSLPRFLTAVGGYIYFSARDATGDAHLWRSDGSEAGTVLVAPDITDPRHLVAAGDRLFFVADRTGTGSGLWVTDPAAFETRLVRKLSAENEAFHLTPTSALGRSLLLYRFTPDGNRELWTSDGTAEGTIRLRSFGTVFGIPNGFRDVGSVVVFNACDARGCEPWTSDGTPSGTRLLVDLAPGAASSYAGWFARAGSRLYFTADDGTGTEVWSLDLDLGPACPGDCNADGRTTIDELVNGVTIALGGASGTCGRIDADNSGGIDIADLVAAVAAALYGCTE
jgi:ELWxxDGT repeat protein